MIIITSVSARYVTGFCKEAQAGKSAVVTTLDAHAWAEYYDGAEGCWKILESTASGTAAQGAAQLREPGMGTETVDPNAGGTTPGEPAPGPSVRKPVSHWLLILPGLVLLLLLRRKFGWKLRYMIVPCLLITIALNHLPLRLPWNFNNCFLAAALMAAGYGIRQINLLERQWKHKWLEPVCYIAAAALVVCIGIWNDAMSTSMLMSAYGPHGDWGPVIYFIGGVIGPCVMLRLCRFLEGRKISHVLMALGQNTIPILALHRTIITYYNRIWVHMLGAQPELSTPQWFLFSVPRLLIAAAGSMGLIYLGRWLKKTYQQRNIAASH